MKVYYYDDVRWQNKALHTHHHIHIDGEGEVISRNNSNIGSINKQYSFHSALFVVW
jgi:hypothetical protein